MPEFTDQERVEKAFKLFGWKCGPVFWHTYHNDPWVFNLTNAVVRLAEENEKNKRALEKVKNAAV